MKRKLSVTVDEDTVSWIEEKLSDCSFRNKSHVIEVAVKRLMENE